MRFGSKADILNIVVPRRVYAAPDFGEREKRTTSWRLPADAPSPVRARGRKVGSSGGDNLSSNCSRSYPTRHGDSLHKPCRTPFPPPIPRPSSRRGVPDTKVDSQASNLLCPIVQTRSCSFAERTKCTSSRRLERLI